MSEVGLDERVVVDANMRVAVAGFGMLVIHARLVIEGAEAYRRFKALVDELELTE